MKETVESSSTTSSPNGNGGSKRTRDPDDEAYLDNFHSHKRYLSEIMASSLNGLTVGESISDNPTTTTESPTYLRDDISLQYSPMSEDSDDARYAETPPNSSMVANDSLPTSPSSPHRYQRPFYGTTTSYPSLSCNLIAAACSQPRQRGSDSEGRFPSSPSDICHSADLRRAALMRSVQMRVHPSATPSYDLPLSPEQESMQNMEAEDRQPCSCRKSLVVNECACQNQQQLPHLYAEVCSSINVSESELGGKPCGTSHMNVEEICEEGFGRTDFRTHDLLSARRSILGGNDKSDIDSSK